MSFFDHLANIPPPEGMSFVEWSLTGAVITLSSVVAYLWKQQRAIHVEQIRWRDQRIIDLEKDEEQLRLRVVELERKVGQLEVEKARLEGRFLVFQSTHESSPLPMWIKDPAGRVLACNRAYEARFLRPRGFALSDYIGRGDDAVWPAEIAAQFRENDQAVYRSGDIWDGEETILDAANRPVRIRVIKYPRYATGIETPFGIAGIAIPDEV